MENSNQEIGVGAKPVSQNNLKLVAPFFLLFLLVVVFWLGTFYEKSRVDIVPPQELAQSQSPASEEKAVNFCFIDYKITPSGESKDTWIPTEFRGISFKRPSYIKVELVEDNYDPSATAIVSLKLSDIRNSPIVQTSVELRYLQHADRGAGLSMGSKYHKEPLYYEFFSDTWWEHQGGFRGSSHATQCQPNESGETDLGFPIYFVSDGPGSWNYYVLMRDQKKLPGGYDLPLVAIIKSSHDVTDESFVTSNHMKSFIPILEAIIQTIEIRPTERG